ncbi:hypothetical protein IFO70_17440 [Phormidium tenue FACHB-886]|nr:hypothetical protein [Phormidium tenue FACHB-886]
MRSITLSALGTLAIAASLALGATASSASEPGVLVSQSSRAEQTCVTAARGRGLQVVDITSVNEYSGGAEVIMEVRQGRNSSSIGCDYSSATRDVELYRIEDNYGNDDDNDNDWQNQYSGDDIRSERDAESIARRVVGQQLGIDDPYSSVVRIDEVQRENGDRDWVVEGRANGAPFVVRLREDGSVQDFQLF